MLNCSVCGNSTQTEVKGKYERIYCSECKGPTSKPRELERLKQENLRIKAKLGGCHNCGSNDWVRKMITSSIRLCVKCRKSYKIFPAINEEEARERYEKIKIKYNLPVFDEALKLFKDDCNSFSYIARTLNIYRSLVRRMYYQVFSGVTTKRLDGIVRRRAKTLKRGITRSIALMNSDKRLIYILGKARELRLHIKPVYIRREGTPYKHFWNRLLLNGYRCFISFANNTYILRRKRYFRFLRRHSIINCDFFMLLGRYEATTRLFIIPSQVINRIIIENGQMSLHVPLSKEDIYWRFGINISQYENAWYLLEKPKS